MNILIALCLLAIQPLSPVYTYNGVKQGILIEVQLPEQIMIGHIVLLNNENEPLSEPAAITQGTHDLTSRIQVLQHITHATWAQLLIDGNPYGTAIVVDPLLSRQVPQTQEATRPDGTSTYTKIVGWVDEAAEDGFASPIINGWRAYLEQEAIMETSEGDIRIALRPDAAPNTVWNFLQLSSGGFYRGSSFHRVVPMSSKGHPFVIQGGDPTGTGSGGPGWWLPIENSSLKHDVGVISMARAGDPDSAGSQFFFCLSRAGTERLDGQYCAFGETIEGGDVIQQIAATPLADPSIGKPEIPPVIRGVELIPAEPRTPRRVIE